jgi:hypothetical protein
MRWNTKVDPYSPMGIRPTYTLSNLDEWAQISSGLVVDLLTGYATLPVEGAVNLAAARKYVQLGTESRQASTKAVRLRTAEELKRAGLPAKMAEEIESGLELRWCAKSETEGLGEYMRVGGHHAHAQAGMKGHLLYDPRNGFSISQEYMRSRGWSHEAMTAKQRQLFGDLATSGRPNTLKEHSRIAVEALKAGGATQAEARQLVADSLKNLRGQGVRSPTHIPWSK